MPTIKSILSNSPSIDQIGVEERVSRLTKRSIKTSSKVEALKLAISMMDLTTLDAKDTPGKVRQLCAKAIRPHESMDDIPSAAAVCVYPNMVAVAKKALAGTKIKVAAVATAFPSGMSTRDVKLRETKFAVAEGADEIDMVINIGAAKQGLWETVLCDIQQVVEASGECIVKVIVETALLTQEEKIKVCEVVLASGAHYIKTSTGFASGGATVADVALFKAIVGESIGIKASGGIRTRQDAEAMIAAGATRLGTSAGICICK
jgi:deoxyribose-phosphate aldolase